MVLCLVRSVLLVHRREATHIVRERPDVRSGSADKALYLTGGFSEYAYIMPQCSVLKVPETLDPALIASGSCVFRTIVHGYEKIRRVATVGTVVIQGGGHVGLYALCIRYRIGCTKDHHDQSAYCTARRSLQMGCEHRSRCSDHHSRGAPRVVRDNTGGQGADLIVECSGVNAAFSEDSNSCDVVGGT